MDMILTPEENIPENVIILQECQGYNGMIDAICDAARRKLEILNRRKRVELPVSKLRLGAQCGGSDAFSGVSANPTIGYAFDLFAALGATVMFSEVTEVRDGIHILADRCQDEKTVEKLKKEISWYDDYLARSHVDRSANPSPGNKKGGISTLEDKSNGCVQKSGSSRVIDVLEYGDTVKQSGLNLLSAPGNDLVASTALAASGCQMVLFTTGRGTPFGSFVPTMKISTNTPLATGKKGWIDFNAGTLAEDEAMPAVAARFIDYVLAVAGGEKVNNEKNGYREIAIFKQGVTL
jgi:altronate hydrolase